MWTALRNVCVARVSTAENCPTTIFDGRYCRYDDSCHRDDCCHCDEDGKKIVRLNSV